MKRLILTITISVEDMDRAKAIKEGIEALAEGLEESAVVTTRYDEAVTQQS